MPLRSGPAWKSRPEALASQAPLADMPAEELPAPVIQRLQEQFGNAIVWQALQGGSGALGDLLARATAQDAEGHGAMARTMLSNQAMGQVMRAERGGAEPDPDAAAALISRSRGAPLPAGIAAGLGELGAELGGAQVHTDEAAALAAEALSARAFAVGEHVYFGRGEYVPGTADGRRLLVHELAHVAQHQRGELPGSGVSSPDDAAEREAERTAARFAPALAPVSAAPISAAPISAPLAPGAPSGPAMRQDDDTSEACDGLDWDVQAAVDIAWQNIDSIGLVCDVESVEMPAFECRPEEAAEEPVAEPPAIPEPELLRLTVEAGGVGESIREVVEQAGALTLPEAPVAGGFSPAVPQLADAYAGYMDKALALRHGLAAGAQGAVTGLASAAADAASQAVASMRSMGAGLLGSLAQTRTQISADAASARVELSTRQHERLAEIALLTGQHLQAVLSRCTAHQTDVRELTASLAQQARAAGAEAADTVLVHAEGCIAQGLGVAEAVADEHADHPLQADIYKAMLQIAKRQGEQVLRDATVAAQGLRQNGEQLALKIEQDGAGFLEHITESSDHYAPYYQSIASQAEHELLKAQMPPLYQLDQLEQDALKALDEVQASIEGQFEALELEISDGIERSATELANQLADEVTETLSQLDAQIETVEVLVSSAHDSQWPMLVDALAEAEAELPASTSEQIEASLELVVHSFSLIPGEIAAGCAASQQAFLAQLADLRSQVSGAFTAVVDSVDLAMAEAVGALDTKVGEISAAQCERLDRAHAEATSGEHGLQTTFDCGTRPETEGSIGHKQAAVCVELDTLSQTMQGEMAEKADRLAGKPTQLDWSRALEGAWAGAWNKFVSNLVIISIFVLLLVLIIALAVALVYFFPGGLIAYGVASVVTGLAALANFFVAAGTVLTLISIGFGALSILRGLLDPKLTSFEKGERIGGGAMDIAFEIVPDMGVDAISRRTAQLTSLSSAVATPSAASQAVQGVVAATHGGADAAGVGKLGGAARGLEGAAAGQPQLVPLAQSAGDLGSQSEKAAAALGSAEAGKAQLEAIGTSDEVLDAVRQAPSGTDDIAAIAQKEIDELRVQYDGALAKIDEIDPSFAQARAEVETLEKAFHDIEVLRESEVAWAQAMFQGAKGALTYWEEAVSASAARLDAAHKTIAAFDRSSSIDPLGELAQAKQELRDATLAHMICIQRLESVKLRVFQADAQLSAAQDTMRFDVGMARTALERARAELGSVDSSLRMHEDHAANLRAQIANFQRIAARGGTLAPPPVIPPTPALPDNGKLPQPEYRDWSAMYGNVLQRFTEAKGSDFDLPGYAVGYELAKAEAASLYQVSTSLPENVEHAQVLLIDQGPVGQFLEDNETNALEIERLLGETCPTEERP
jgi:hypothetical protein